MGKFTEYPNLLTSNTIFVLRTFTFFFFWGTKFIIFRRTRNNFPEFFITVLPSKVSEKITEDPNLFTGNTIFVFHTVTFCFSCDELCRDLKNLIQLPRFFYHCVTVKSFGEFFIKFNQTKKPRYFQFFFWIYYFYIISLHFFESVEAYLMNSVFLMTKQ